MAVDNLRRRLGLDRLCRRHEEGTDREDLVSCMSLCSTDTRYSTLYMMPASPQFSDQPSGDESLTIASSFHLVIPAFCPGPTCFIATETVVANFGRGKDEMSFASLMQKLLLLRVDAMIATIQELDGYIPFLPTMHCELRLMTHFYAVSDEILVRVRTLRVADVWLIVADAHFAQLSYFAIWL